MFKELGILLAGVFVGAVGAELIRKSSPKLVNKVGRKSREGISNLKEAFMVGYESATHRQETAKVSA